MKDDTVRRLEALADEYAFPVDAAGAARDDLFDEIFGDLSVLDSVHDDAA
jgi:hypothetical protein